MSLVSQKALSQFRIVLLILVSRECERSPIFSTCPKKMIPSETKKCCREKEFRTQKRSPNQNPGLQEVIAGQPRTSFLLQQDVVTPRRRVYPQSWGQLWRSPVMTNCFSCREPQVFEFWDCVSLFLEKWLIHFFRTESHKTCFGQTFTPDAACGYKVLAPPFPFFGLLWRAQRCTP